MIGTLSVRWQNLLLFSSTFSPTSDLQFTNCCALEDAVFFCSRMPHNVHGTHLVNHVVISKPICFLPGTSKVKNPCSRLCLAKINAVVSQEGMYKWKCPLTVPLFHFHSE